MSYEKELPPGSWLMFNQLPPLLSDVEFQTYLAGRGVNLPLENISVRHYPQFSSAKVAIPRSLVTILVNWAIENELLDGYVVAAEPFGGTRATERIERFGKHIKGEKA